jgi:DNA-binding IclR family transcriptional regulator
MAKVRGAASLDKGVELLLAILSAGEGAELAQIAARADIPSSTAHRLVAALISKGALSRVGPGRYAPGLRLVSAMAPERRDAVLAAAARPLLGRLAAEIGATAHLGVLEGDMVTYLVKAHGGGSPVLTRELIQLEAYCSGIGKVLLAHLDTPAREAYLAAGPFVALTARTTTEPEVLRGLLTRIRDQGFAVDDAELEDDLYCLAVPVTVSGGGVVAALSASIRSDRPADQRWLAPLRRCAEQIGGRLGGG